MSQTRDMVVPFVREEAVGALNHTVAELCDLFASVKQVYWNLRGVSFLGLHRFLDEFAGRTLVHIDAAAELAMALGGTVEGAWHKSAIYPPSKEMPAPSIAGISGWLRELANVNAACGEHVHAAVGKMRDAGELGTADLLTAIAQDLDQQFRMLEAHIDQQFQTA